MFPKDELTLQVATVTDTTFKKCFVFDYDKNKFVFTDGKIEQIDSIGAVKQWLTLFFKTYRDGALVYKGTAFGQSIRRLKGRKSIETGGFDEAEVEREIKEGVLLCSAIESIRSFNLTKDGKSLVVAVDVVLYDGTVLKVSEYV